MFRYSHFVRDSTEIAAVKIILHSTVQYVHYLPAMGVAVPGYKLQYAFIF